MSNCQNTTLKKLEEPVQMDKQKWSKEAHSCLRVFKIRNLTSASISKPLLICSLKVETVNSCNYTYIYTEYVQVNINVMGISEKLLHEWLLGWHCLCTNLVSHRVTLVPLTFWSDQFLIYMVKNCCTEIQKCQQAIRPIVHWRQSFCWRKSWFRNSCIFPKHQKALLL